MLLIWLPTTPNRTKLELKQLLLLTHFRWQIPPNRTKLELKLLFLFGVCDDNNTPNRTKLELKHRYNYFKWVLTGTGSQSYQVGIETYLFLVPFSLYFSPNRTKLELKQSKSQGRFFCIPTPNRTKLELKQEKLRKKKIKEFPPNRTKLELKPLCGVSQLQHCNSQSYQVGIETFQDLPVYIRWHLPIVPSWNWNWKHTYFIQQ